MDRNQNSVSVGGALVLSLVLLSAIALEEGFVSNPAWYNVLYITIPLLLIVGIVSRRGPSEPTTASKRETHPFN